MIDCRALGKRYRSDVKFRTKVSLYRGFFVNQLYIALKLGLGVYYRSWWFITLAAYYALLAVVRILLLWRWGELDRNAELRRYRACGIMLLMMSPALAGIVILMVCQDQGYDYPGMLIYAMATYAFYAVTVAIVNLVKFRRYGSPVLSAAKAVNLVTAMVSILALETAMLAQFGKNDSPEFRNIMTGATGGGVCVIVLGMAVFMISKSTKSIKQLKLQNHCRQLNSFPAPAGGGETEKRQQ